MRVPGQRVHVGGRVCPGVVQRDLPIVGEQVLHGAIVTRHSDESVPAEMPSSIVHTCEEDCQVVHLPFELASRGAIALLYSLVAVALVLGSSKLRMVCECPGPKAKAS